MILWQSLHVEVYRDTYGQASASDATLINTSQCRALDDQQVGAAPDVAARLPDSGWAAFRRDRSPK
jgi:hypothetical protein